MFHTTRLRLAIWYTLVTAVLLLVFGAGFYGYVRLTLIDRIDDTIAHVVEILERSLILPSFNLSTDLGNDLEADHIEVEWFSPQGQLLGSTLPPGLTLGEIKPGYRTVYLTDQESLRQFTKAVTQNQEFLGFLRVSHPWFEVTKPINQLLVDLAIGILVTLVLVGICGWWLSALAIQPIKDAYHQLKQFTADVSHELRNPIAVIQTNVQVALADPSPDWSSQQRQLEVIERLTRRLAKLLDDLLFLARHEGQIAQGEWQPVDLDQILATVIEEQEVFWIPNQIQVITHRDQFPHLVLGYPDQLERLITNLLSNAISFSPAGSEIKISLTANPRLELQIQDLGAGIDPADLPYIFDRFWHRSGQLGSGLGLAIVKAIADRHQATIKVNSQVGLGTSFLVQFPARN
ncbi:MAG: HAMP domain-containing sensor histidine kinase [Pseudanabaenaceae cyanobacterium bins.68]|nr:HAMP domain-containing sensor histidine kinase [Pseudanabaenaceae cyanobacterium bins.68]